VSLRGLLLGACASLCAILAALAALEAADRLGEALGLGALRPLVLVTVLFLSLTVLQAAWDRIERIIRPPSRRGHVSEGSAE
jgi:hypothetical protein